MTKTTITAVELREIRVSLPRAFSGGTYQVTARATLLCRITATAMTGNGKKFIGLVAVGNETNYGDELKSLVLGPFRDYLLGKDPLDTEKHWDSMLRADKTLADRKSVMCAVATVDTALWDVKGKILGAPAWQLFGGYDAKVPVIGIGGYYENCRDADGIRAEIQRFRDQQLCGIKLKVGAAATMDEDVERVRVAREAGGADFVIVVDSNMCWSVEEATRFASLVEGFKPEWFEEPTLQRLGADGLLKIRGKTKIPLAAGQSEPSVFEARALLDQAVDVLNVTFNRGGGVTGWLKVAHEASLKGVRMSQVAEPAISMHLFAAIKNRTYVEIYPDADRDPIWAELYLNKPKLENGFITVPEKPGFGLEFNESFIEQNAVEPWRSSL